MAIYDTPDKAILTSASPTAATSLTGTSPAGALLLMALINTNSFAQVATVSLYDEAIPAGAIANQVYSGLLGAGQVILFGINGIPIKRGLVSLLSQAVGANVIVVWAFRDR